MRIKPEVIDELLKDYKKPLSAPRLLRRSLPRSAPGLPPLRTSLPDAPGSPVCSSHQSGGTEGSAGVVDERQRRGQVLARVLTELRRRSRACIRKRKCRCALCI